MKKFVVANWKMHGDFPMAHTLTGAIAGTIASLLAEIEVVLCPPAILVAQVAEWLAGSKAKIGGQDCHSQPEGAHTGDISAPMLKQAGCTYVIVGHSERRNHHHESNDDIRSKAGRAIKSGLTPIICIGESEAERNNGKAIEIVSQQVRESIPEEATNGNFVLAYEPVWAIGSGKIPSVDDIRQMHSAIIAVAAKRTSVAMENVHVLYGGSVKPDNAAELMAIEGVAGVLVGGASLKSGDFCQIIEAAKSK